MMFINPSVIFNGLLWPRLLVPQWIMTNFTDACTVILHTRLKTFSILSLIRPKFRAWKDKKNLSKVLLHLSKFGIIESPIRINFALIDDVDMVTCFLKKLYQPNLPFVANALVREFAFNG